MSSLVRAKEGTDAEVGEVAGKFGIYLTGGRKPLGSGHASMTDPPSKLLRKIDYSCREWRWVTCSRFLWHSPVCIGLSYKKNSRHRDTVWSGWLCLWVQMKENKSRGCSRRITNSRLAWAHHETLSQNPRDLGYSSVVEHFLTSARPWDWSSSPREWVSFKKIIISHFQTTGLFINEDHTVYF